VGPEEAQGLALRDVVVRYESSRSAEGVVAVDGVSLNVAPGQVLALLGPSGCGKSTLLRAMVGLEPLASGSIAWNGSDLARIPVHRRGFGLMFQDGQLFAHRDVAGNIAYGISRMPRAERDRRIAELLDVVGLGGYGRRAVGTLSGGERQRVALARALAPRPRLLLLDEPLSALDRGLRDQLAADLREILVATGTTAVCVTHDHDEAFTVADRVAVMDAGHLLQVAAPAELWREPATRRVAEFLGYQAFVPVPPGWSSERAPQGAGLSAVVAVGPQGFVATADAPEGRTSWAGTVVAAGLRRGVAEVTVDVDLPGAVEPRHGSSRRSRIVAVAGPEPHRVGDPITVRLDRAGCAVVSG
jgi:thiamine transport system ATP-binding protein